MTALPDGGLPTQWLDTIEQRVNAATPGPWDSNGGCEIYTTAEADTMTLWIGGTERFGDSDVGPANAEFIAHARTDVPALLAEVRRLTAERDTPTPADEQRRTCPTHGYLTPQFDPSTCTCPPGT